MNYVEIVPVAVAVCGMALRIALFFPRQDRKQ
jgi:hypothetical protein